jgi:hypothetical protein
MSARPTVITFVVVAVVGIGALFAAVGADQRWTAFSPEVPPSQPIKTLEPGAQACQAPFRAVAGFGSVRTWISALARRTPALWLGVYSPRGATIATGRTEGGHGQFVAVTFNLNATVPGGRRVVLCLHNAGPQSVTLLGANERLAYLFLRRHPESLLSLLPTVFRRAALFRPTWVGAWTFWLLLAGLLAAFVVGAVAVVQAAKSDALSPPLERETPDQPGG